MIRYVLIALLLSGCASQPEVKEPVRPDPVTVDLMTQLQVPRPDVVPNISIQVFSAGNVSNSSVYSSSVQVKKVEQRVVPYVLKTTLDRSGLWGAVRVLPRPDASAELQITGWILSSDGLELSVSVRAVDASGRVWLEQIYYDVASPADYATDPVYTIDPFQDLYNSIANDLADLLLADDPVRLADLNDIALVRYGELLSVDSFSRYLSKDAAGEYGLVGLPARDDPVLARVLRIRESEYLFADSMDAHFESLYRRVGPTYAWWRFYSYELIMGNQRLQSIDATRGASSGSWYALDRVYKTYKDSKMNEDALRELTESFNRETASTSAEISGRVVRLNGTLSDQYVEWRELLRQLYDDEVGQP